MDKKLVIIGASGHGKVIADIAENNGYTHILFLDDNPIKKTCGLYPIVGTSEDAINYSDSDFIVGIGNAKIRKKIQKMLHLEGLNVISLVHPNAVIANNVEIGIGTVIMAGVVVNSGAYIGSGCIINTCSSIDHDCNISDYVHISVGAHVAGTVKIGENTWIGAGAIISNNITICPKCIIGAGAVVVRDINLVGTYVGIPAKKIK